MAELKTKKTKESVTTFIQSIKDEGRRKDAKELLALFKEATGMPASMWGDSMIGFGSFHYQSDRSGQQGDWPLTAFSPRKQNLTIYCMSGLKEYEELLTKLGPHKKSSGSCLYLKRLSDVHLPTLRALIKRSVKDTQKKYSRKN